MISDKAEYREGKLEREWMTSENDSAVVMIQALSGDKDLLMQSPIPH